MISDVSGEFIKKLMPELEGLHFEIQELKGGITNQLYRVRCSDGRDYVFRIYGERTELFINRNVEAENLSRLEPLGVTPRLVKFLPDQGVTIVEFITGFPLKNDDFLKKDLWERILYPIRRIHRSGIQLPGVFNPMAEVKRLYDILEGMSAQYPEFEMQETIRRLEKINDLAGIAPSEYVSCHNDLLADNFILTDRGGAKESVCLIDWEYAGMAPIHYDLADMFQEILVPRQVEQELLSIYWQGQDIDHHEYMTDLFKPFPDIYWFLWSLIQQNISAIEYDYYLYGRVKFENAQKNINHIKDDYALKI
jgi:thiamine kinase-like enzyme